MAALPGKPVIDPGAIESFLRYRYVPSPLTIFDGIRKLAGGTCLIVDEGQAPKLERWWNFTPVPFDPMPSDHEAEEQLLAIYSAAVKRHLISDVPVGLLLSGGLDSALLLALMSQTGKSWHTYTVGYGNSFADDELRDAALTARLLGSSNTGIEISCSIFEDSMEKVACALEEPVATASVIPMYYLCRRARQDVKVALIGQGPDELFAGYNRHLGVHYGKYWRALPDHGRLLLKAFLGSLPRTESVKRALYSLDEPDQLTRYQQVFSIVSRDTLRTLFHQGVLTDQGDNIPQHWHELAPAMQHIGELGGLQFLEIRSSLPDELLMYADKLSMAHSLELRVPFLDQEIVEYVERLESSLKVRYGKGKWLHRRVARKFLPKQILLRSKKGFASNVVDDWLRKSLAASIHRIFADPDSYIYRYLRAAPVNQLIENHKSLRSDNHKILFSLAVLEHLLRQYDSTVKPKNGSPLEMLNAKGPHAS